MVGCAGFNRAYEVRFLGVGAIEFQRVGRAFLHLVALTAFGAFATKTDLSRGFLLLALPMTFLLSIAGRYAARKVLHSRRKRGGATVPVLVVGNAIDIVKFSDTLRLNDHAGLQMQQRASPSASQWPRPTSRPSRPAGSSRSAMST